MAEPLALSTMYFQRWSNQRSLEPFFELGYALGVDRFELGHTLTPEAVAGVDPARARIAAVHHPCPAAPELGAGDTLTASDPAGRARAAAALRQSILTAARLGARAVVMHLGYAEDDAVATCSRLRFELASRFRAGQGASEPSAQVRARLRAFLDAHEDDHLDRARAMLPPLLDLAHDHGIGLGLETGYHAHELPRPAGMRRLLDELGDGGLGAWLDTGHVGAQVGLGLVSFDAWFGAVGGRWLGVHLHDLVGLRDHLVPGMGILDFAALCPRLPPNAGRTCEVDWYFTPAELAQGIGHLRRAGCDA